MPAGYGSSKDSLAGGRGAADNASGRAGASSRGGASSGSAGQSGGRRGGGPSYQNGQYPGLTTGTTIYGNTAFGRPGHMADGYATLLGNEYGNFRNLDGSYMFADSPQQGAFTRAPNANSAFGSLLGLYNGRGKR